MNFTSSLDEVKQILIEDTKFLKSFENCCDGVCTEEVKAFIDRNMKRRLEYGEKLIEMKAYQKRVDAMLQQASDEANSVEEFKEIFAKLQEEDANKQIKTKQTTEYKEFKKEMEQCNFNAKTPVAEDNAIEVLETGSRAVSMHDPWSKAIMRNPVRNIKCGHHYDHETVKALMESSHNGVRCPVVGCPNKAHIQLQHLQADHALHSEIQDYIAEQNPQESSEEEA